MEVEALKGWLAQKARQLHLRRVRTVTMSRVFLAKHRAPVGLAVLVLAIAATLVVVEAARMRTTQFYAVATNFDSLKSLLLGLGCSLLGATALVFTLILFAMQVNVGRMPSALFSRFSQDSRLLAAFVLTLALSIGVASLSLSDIRTAAVWLIATAIWATTLAVAVFIYSYRRAIRLTNPADQVRILARTASAHLQRWGKLADSAVPLLGAPPVEPQLDPRRVYFLKANPGWEQEARNLSEQIVSYGSRLGELGDHESFKLMLRGMVSIHASYVEAKRQAFFNSNPFFDVPDARDSFLLSTLEQLRVTATASAKRGDEQLCMTCFKAFADLFSVYSAIEYSGTNTHKYHANLIGSYLQSQVEATASHRMPDVMMEGVRQVGMLAKKSISAGTDVASSYVRKVGTLATIGAVDQAHRPVTQTAMEQLAESAYIAVLSDRGNGGHVPEAIREAAFSGASTLIQLADEPSTLSSVHKSYVAPYFSTSDNAALLRLITSATNAVLTGQAAGKEQRIIRGVHEWADGLHRPLRELLLQALAKKSSLTFDLLHWPSIVANILMALAQSEHCDDRMRDELRETASTLAGVFTWIPATEDTVRLIEANSFKELLFDLAIDAKNHDSEEVYVSARSTLLNWSVSAGRHQLGWATLEQGLLLLAALDIRYEHPEGVLTTQVAAAVARQPDFPRERRERAVQGLREEARRHRGAGYALSRSEAVLAEVDQPSLSRLLTALAQALDA